MQVGVSKQQKGPITAYRYQAFWQRLINAEMR